MPDKKDHEVIDERDYVEGPDLRALLFELDSVAVEGRELIYDVLSGILEGKGVDFTFGLFCQHCLYTPVKNSIPAILEKSGRTRLSEEKLVSEVNEAVKLMFIDGNLKLNAGMNELIDGAIQGGAAIGTVSGFDEETTGKIMTKLGLTDRGAIALSNGSEDKNMPSTDAWLKLAKSMKMPPSCCVVMASSSRACKAALAAGMHCVVLPDKFTSFQDFGGADFVLESIDEQAKASILELLKF